MSQWAEVRHLHLVEGVPKKEIARRLKLDVKTVRRAIGRPTPPVRVSPQRVRSLDPWRKQIEEWLHDDPRLTAKRVRRLLLPLAGPVSQRTVRRYVAALKSAVKTKEAFVHRSALPGATMEVDFGETWVDLAGAPCKVKYLVATLPYSNAYFAKAYPIERLESLLDGIESAFLYFGGATARVVLDNTSLAVKEILAGRDRVQTEAFEAFRGAYPFRAEFCAPAKGWEKGSVEGGVKYARNLVFRPRLAIKSWAALNAAVLTELEADLPLRHLDDGRSAQEALALERQHLRALPEHLPATCRVVARVADKFGHVRVDHVTYSVPIRHAYRPAWVKLYHDRVAIAVGAEVVAQHRRVFCRGAKVGNDSLSGLSLTSTQPASGSIPGPGEPGYETWGGVPFEQRAHVGAWMVPSYERNRDAPAGATPQGRGRYGRTRDAQVRRVPVVIRLALARVEAGGAAAHRLGHAVALHADPEPNQLLARMRRRGIAIETSSESNRQILGVDPLGHPFVDYLAAGVPVVLATDDPGLMLSDLRQQFALAARNPSVSYPTLKTFAMNSIAFSFLPDADRQRLLRGLEDDFAAFEATPWELWSPLNVAQPGGTIIASCGPSSAPARWPWPRLD